MYVQQGQREARGHDTGVGAEEGREGREGKEGEEGREGKEGKERMEGVGTAKLTLAD